MNWQGISDIVQMITHFKGTCRDISHLGSVLIPQDLVGQAVGQTLVSMLVT